MNYTIQVFALSGVEDGTVWRLNSDYDGEMHDTTWSITIGRTEGCPVRLANDSFASRQHARLHLRDGAWWLEDLKSRNGTFTPKNENFLEDDRVEGIVPLRDGQLMRVGRTWLRIGR